jgi:hypothetical protein
MRFLFYFLIALSFASCAVFETPQPYGVPPLKEVPDELYGKYTVENTEDLSTITIGKSEILITTHEKGKFNKQQLKKIGDSYYTVVKSEFGNYVIGELTRIQFRNDSAFADVVVEEKFQLGYNLEIKKVDSFYIFNFLFVSDGGDQGWTPLLMDNFGRNYRTYLLSNDYIEEIEVKGVSNGSLRDLTVSDIRGLFSDRSDLILYIELDAQRKIFREYE